MNLDARFRVLVFAQVVLGIAAFCLAEANLGLMLIAGSLALASWYFAEGPRGRPLPRWLVNAGSLVAVGVMVAEVNARGQAGLIVAMGHFTMALQLLMLYAQKTNREYSMLLVLSLIQMIGASVLSVSIVYGVLLATYCGLALVTVLLFQIKATGDGVHQRRTAAAHAVGLTQRPRRPAVVSGRGWRWQFRGAWAAIGVASAVVAAGVFVVLPRSGDIPALGVQTRGQAAAKRTGFSPTVSLAGGAPREGSPDAVLNLSVRQYGVNVGSDGRAFLLRGAALDHYDARAHQWQRSGAVAAADRPVRIPRGGVQLAELNQDFAALEATVTLRDPSPGVVFVPSQPQMPGGAIGWVDSPHLDQVHFNPVDRQVKAGDPKVSAITYQTRVAGMPNAGVQEQYERLYLDALTRTWAENRTAEEAASFATGSGTDRRHGLREAAWSAWAALPFISTEAVTRMRAAIQRRDPPSGEAGVIWRSGWPRPRGFEPGWVDQRYARSWTIQTERIREYTLGVLADHGLEREPAVLHGPDDAKIATTLANHLRDGFRYDLSNPRALPGSDPVIDFLFEHQAGHCELFASALAVMCRSINIPARVITGYRASEYNPLGGYYVVRHNHAHAWTEVHCGPEVGWRTYDATPPAEVGAEHAATGPGWLSAARQVYEFLEFTWVRSVVAYDERTRQSLLQTMNRRVVRAVTGEEGVPARLWGWVAETFGGWRLRSVGAAMTLAGAALLAFASGSVAVAIWRRRRRRSALRLDKLPPRQARDLARRLHFYLDLFELLDRHGYRRPHWQGPAEFARDLRDTAPRIAEPVNRLVDLFYRVRFGHEQLSPYDQARVRRELLRLESALAKP